MGIALPTDSLSVDAFANEVRGRTGFKMSLGHVLSRSLCPSLSHARVHTQAKACSLSRYLTIPRLLYPHMSCFSICLFPFSPALPSFLIPAAPRALLFTKRTLLLQQSKACVPAAAVGPPRRQRRDYGRSERSFCWRRRRLQGGLPRPQEGQQNGARSNPWIPRSTSLFLTCFWCHFYELDGLRSFDVFSKYEFAQARVCVLVLLFACFLCWVCG